VPLFYLTFLVGLASRVVQERQIGGTRAARAATSGREIGDRT